MKLGYVLALLALALMFLPGCALFNSVDLTYQRNTTIGKELMDLEDAKRKGAINKREYEQLREEILKGGPVPDLDDDDDD